MDSGKRKYLRVNYPCSITIWRNDGSSEVVLANTANISVGGLCVYLNQPAVVGSQLQIKIDNFFEAAPLQCMCAVVRCESDPTHQDPRQTFYQVAVEFQDMDAKSKDYLTVFVERLSALESKKKD